MGAEVPSASENYAGVFDGRIGFGARPALLMIDFMAAYTTPGADFYGEGIVEAVVHSVDLLNAARKAGIPVIHTRVEFHPSGKDGGLFVRKVPALRALVPGHPLGAFDSHVQPTDDELVIIKNYASAFFGTSLQATLSADGVDTIILAGCSTSGCIRATAIDGIQHGFRVIVPRECVGDRHDGPHEANLFDINAKYGDVVGRDEVIGRLGKAVAAT
ncbi:MAG: N-carbamoylsarcosine amidohydrolase [Pseudomonadota bacterium]